MKYGESLRQRSIPAWSHCKLCGARGKVPLHRELTSIASPADNIDYDDIKLFIKERTTVGKGKTIPVPGQADESLLETENELFSILEDQHHRIDLFVRSKAGEIRRRLGES